MPAYSLPRLLGIERNQIALAEHTFSDLQSGISKSTILPAGVYCLPEGLAVNSDNVVIDGNGCRLIGDFESGSGIKLNGRRNVTLRNLQIAGYRHGIVCENCDGITIQNCHVRQTIEIAPNTIFLDIWLNEENCYGAGILLVNCTNCEIVDNDLQHQQNGILTYHCSHLRIKNNNVSYSSGYGIHLFDTSDSLFESNCADYCCRFEPREGGRHYGHMGADATGFLIVYNSCRNVFKRNTARMGGDGFFLAGLSPDGTKVGCNDNLFEENDASLSPNIAFEATFSSGNRFLNNYADRCNYGFWLGFSTENTISGNRMIHNRQAGIGVENGTNISVTNNDFQKNGHGVLLWTHFVEQFAKQFPENITSSHWDITDNTFLKNRIGIRIAADQDHGIRNLPVKRSGQAQTRPRYHRIIRNQIHEGRLGIELSNCDHTEIRENIVSGNSVANFSQIDCNDTTIINNLGAGGGYL